MSRAVLGKSQTQRHFPMEPPRWSPEAMARSFGSLSASRSGNTEENLTWQRQLLRSESPLGLRWHLLFERGQFVFFRTFCIIFILTLPIFVSFSCDQNKSTERLRKLQVDLVAYNAIMSVCQKLVTDLSSTLLKVHAFSKCHCWYSKNSALLGDVSIWFKYDSFIYS